MIEIDQQSLEKIWGNKRIRQRLAHEHPLWFSLLYLRHHFAYPLAPFHIEMFHLIRKAEQDFIVIMAFRESGKSTIMNTANALWSILGKPEKKFVLIVSKTQEQAKNHFTNIKAELENNEPLKDDFGPFIENDEDLKRLSLELVYHGSKIMSVTREQSIRGMKYGQFRPDLVICDDLEDISSVFDRKESEMLYERFEKELVPIGSAGTRIIVLGNLLSKHSFMTRLKNDIDESRITGIFRAYPLLDDRGNNLWLGKFPDRETINKFRAKISGETWAREYLLTFDSSRQHYDTEDDTLGLVEGGADDIKIITTRAERKLAELHSRYDADLYDVKLQQPLIRQMDGYRISAPTRGQLIVPEPGDSRYERYQEYEKELNKIVKEYEEAMRVILTRA